MNDRWPAACQRMTTTVRTTGPAPCGGEAKRLFAARIPDGLCGLCRCAGHPHAGSLATRKVKPAQPLCTPWYYVIVRIVRYWDALCDYAASSHKQRSPLPA